MAHQDRYFRRVQDVTSDATKDHLSDAAARVRTLDQHVRTELLGLFQNRFACRSRTRIHVERFC